MKALGYYNGKIGPVEEMTVPMNDRACYFGDGVYDATVARNGVIFLLDEHVDRIFRSAAGVRIEPPCTKEEMKDVLNDLVSRMDGETVMVYWQITRGTAKRTHSFPEGIPSNLWITVSPMPLRDTKKPMKLTETEDRRYHFCHIKTLNLILNVLANQKAKDEGCDECVFHRGSRVTEGSHTNVSILKDGVLKTAPLDELILPGIARHHLLMAAEKLGIPVQEEAFTLEELASADEVLITSSTTFIARADTYLGRPLGGRAPELYEKLRAAVMDEFLTATEAR